MALNLKDYSISEKTGFAMENPQEKLPAEFEEWNRLAENMPKLVEEGTMREEIEKMEELDWNMLTDAPQQRLAHLLLGIMASGYVWQGGEGNAAEKLPRCVAVPLCGLSEHLGLMPIITYADVILANYRPTDPDKPLALDNLSAFYCFPGDRTASEWFVIIHVAIELEFAKAFKHVLGAVAGGKTGDEKSVTDSLVQLAQVVDAMQKIFKQISEKLPPDTFFKELRPYASGWGGAKNPLPDGLIYEGVHGDHPQKARGGSAAQSGTMQVLDALLGVEHSPDKEEFMAEMRNDYILPDHSRFIEDVRKESGDMQKMVLRRTNQALIQAFNNLLGAMETFRGFHLNIAKQYIERPAARNQENSFESLNATGTGGTDLYNFLRDLMRTTRARYVMPLSSAAVETPHAACGHSD